jgi:pimeloyl-ACP methyl ester carboxylesterase/DNA-binding CsgD family transcriptional regulator
MSPPPQQIRFCTSRDGARIAYATCGAGPPLVWLQHWIHHLEFDWDSPIWGPWLSVLTRRHTLIRYDWRGCGLSDRERITFSLDQLVEDLEAVTEAAGHERFALFGMAGAGSGIAASYAVRHPEQVERLILHGCHMKGRWANNPSHELVQEGQARLKVYELGWRNDTQAYRRFFSALHLPDANDQQIKAYNDLLRQATSQINAINLLRLFWQLDFSECQSQLRCPTLILHSRRDSVIPFDEGRKVAALIPGAQFVPLESRNHVLLENEPAWPQFVDAIERFLPYSSSHHGPSSLVSLTARERDVLEVLALGFTNGGIAQQLHISEKTARNHLSTIFSKLGVGNRGQAIILAREAGFGRRALPLLENI